VKSSKNNGPLPPPPPAPPVEAADELLDPPAPVVAADELAWAALAIAPVVAEASLVGACCTHALEGLVASANATSSQLLLDITPSFHECRREIEPPVRPVRAEDPCSRAATCDHPLMSESRPTLAQSPQIDRVLDYLSFVAQSQPLTVLLDEAPRKVAACVGADIASLYLLEGDGRTLVLRGNVGFPKKAQGVIRLSVGEGITGMAVESRYPVSLVDAPEHANYRSFPQLDEERFPVFLAVPILGPAKPLGAVVVQRAGSEPFSHAEVSLLAALTAPISAGLRLARLLDDLRDKPRRRAGSGTHKVTLPGVPIVSGRALGAIAAMRRPATTPGPLRGQADGERLQQALDTTRQALTRLAVAAKKSGYGAKDAAFLESYLLMIDDQRLRETALERLGEGASLHAALGEITRAATKAAAGSGDKFLVDRAADMEHLCDALLMMAVPDARAELPNRAVVVTDELTIYDVLVTARVQPVAFVLTQGQLEPRSRLLMELLGVPAIADVAGALRWIGPGDLALVDADHGFFIVNPSRADIAAFRAERKRSNERTSRLPGA
jgi:phosphotransferase system enzyme I (PtsP)